MGASPRRKPKLGPWPRGNPQWGLGLARCQNGGLDLNNARMGAWPWRDANLDLASGDPTMGACGLGDARMEAKTWTMPKWGLDLTRCQNVS